MNVHEALELLEHAATPAPPGCRWLSWDILGDDLVRPIRGFADEEGRVGLDAAIVGLFELNNAANRDECLKLIRDAEGIACRRIVSLTVADARPPGDIERAA